MIKYLSLSDVEQWQSQLVHMPFHLQGKNYKKQIAYGFGLTVISYAFCSALVCLVIVKARCVSVQTAHCSGSYMILALAMTSGGIVEYRVRATHYCYKRRWQLGYSG